MEKGREKEEGGKSAFVSVCLPFSRSYELLVYACDKGIQQKQAAVAKKRRLREGKHQQRGKERERENDN